MRPLALVVLDGWGHSTQKLGNAIANAHTPTIEMFETNYPALTLQASGNSVGLAWGEPGNSEVGHLTIGAGRTIFQYSTRINRAIESGDFFKNPVLLSALDHAKQHNSALHVVGLLGSGTVHSSFDHLIALMKLAKQENVPKLYFNLFSDGKDSGLKEFPEVFTKLQANIQKIGIGILATVIGRQFGLDRDNNWDRTQQAYDLMVSGKGTATSDVLAQLQRAYAAGASDTSLPGIVVDPAGLIKDNDAIIFLDYREDSVRQIASSFLEPEFLKFSRVLPQNLFIALMTQYLEDPKLNLHVAFPLPEVHNGLAEVLSVAGKKQLHIAETEKYAHTTYFFNCFRGVPFEGEEDILLDSPKNAHDHPEMRAGEIADTFVQQLQKDLYDFFVINYANADILSHLGNLENAIKGIESVDAALGKMYTALMEKDGILVVTADHGNAESLVYKETGAAETRHDLSPVPLYVIAREFQRPRSHEDAAAAMQDPKGLISDLAPTLLDLMQMQTPVEMTGASLVSLLSS